MPTFGSLFAGVGGFDLGFEAAGWEPRWQVEWDERCRSVLERHWPQVTRYGDVRDVRDPEPVDLVTYGFPCQDLSVAGRRAGLDGDRSGLFFEATRIIKEMRDASGGTRPTWAVAENVCGLLNADRGAAMGRCLDELAAIGAVDIEWGVVDAQYVGLPQRRKRVFIVARFGAGDLGPEPLLPLSEGRAGHPDTSAAQGQGSPGGAGSGAGGGSALGGFAGHLDGLATARASGQDQGGGSDVLVPTWVKARRAQTVDDCETWEPDGPAPTLNAFDNGSESRATVLAFSHTQGLDPQVSTKAWPTLRGGGGGHGVMARPGVRRLTPRECERLMGWPDDHTRWAADGTEIADTPRYRMAGNGVAAPVAEWIARRILAAHLALPAGRREHSDPAGAAPDALRCDD